MRVEVKGTEQLSQIARVLETKGNSRALKRRMTKAFKKAAEPITRDQRENLLTKLPHSGGAAEEIGSEARTVIRTGWSQGTVDILDSWPSHDIKAIEEGRLRHPTFARLTRGGEVGRSRGDWHVTKVEPGLLSGPFDDHKTTVRAELAKEMDALAEEIARET